MHIDRELYELYYRQLRNALYEVECAKTLKDAQKAAKRADDALTLLHTVAIKRGV